MEGKEQTKCALCGREFSSFYDKNNGWPLTEKFVCGDCNLYKVMPVRLAKMYKTEKEKE